VLGGVVRGRRPGVRGRWSVAGGARPTGTAAV